MHSQMTNGIPRLIEFHSPEQLAGLARAVQEKMFAQGLYVPPISKIMLGLTRGRYQEFLDDEPPSDPASDNAQT